MTPQERKVMELALEALLESKPFLNDLDSRIKHSTAITTTKEALAQPKEPEQEPVGKFAKFTDNIWREVTDGSAGVPLYTTPPQRKPLTREQIVKCQEEASDEWCGVEELFVLYARAIEAAHNIKE